MTLTRTRGRSGKVRFDPTQIGWRLGRAHTPATGQPLWVPWDRTTGVLGPQGSGKTLDLLVPALLDAPGAALATTTKPDDLYLTWTHRSRDPHGGRDRPASSPTRSDTHPSSPRSSGTRSPAAPTRGWRNAALTPSAPA